MMKKLKSPGFKTRLYLHYLACLAGALIMMLGCHYSESGRLHFVVYFGIAILAAGLIFRILFIKCPHCGDGLYQAHTDLGRCPNCGKKLQ